MRSALSLRGVSAGWGPRVALVQFDLELGEGEVLCLLGPGGSGKSTILRVIEDLIAEPNDDPDNQLWWRGTGHASFDSCARLRQHGEFRRERVADLLTADGQSDADAWMPPGPVERAAIMAVLDIPLGEVPDPLRRFLSFVLVARSSAPLLMFDEPCFALEGAWRQAVRAQLRKLIDAGRTILLVTHHLPLAREFANRVILIVDGRVIEAASTEDFFCRARHPRSRQFIEWGA